MRKFFSLLLALVATTSLWAHNFEVDGIFYDIIDENNVEVTYKGSDYDSCRNEYSGEVTIPETVTYNGKTYAVIRVGDDAFYYCSSLISILIPNSVKNIGNLAFAGCASLASICIGTSVTSIGLQAFSGCSSLTSFTIPNSVKSIGNFTFDGCSSLTSVTIPNSVKSIGDQAFSGCSGLTSIVVKNGNAYYDSRENCNAIIETATNTLIAGCRNTIIPESVTNIGRDAFYRCSFTSITIPNSVTSIGTEAFFHCSSLASIAIPSSVTSIGFLVFASCTSLTSVFIPNNVTSIGAGAFYSCTSLESITIGNGVSNIGRMAFAECTSLDTVTCLAMTPPALLGEDVFYGCDNPTLFVPCAALSDYQAHEQWGQFTTIECIASEEAKTEEVVVESGTTTIQKIMRDGQFIILRDGVEYNAMGAQIQ